MIKDVDLEVRKLLRPFGLEDKLYLRSFDESNEDSRMWDKGGLSFNDPETGLVLGSNDSGWFIDNAVPLVIVEGTFGTERGQFGDGQLNRFSHSLSVAMNGYIGVTLVPLVGQSFIKKGKKNDILCKKINFSNGLIHKGMLTGAINCNSLYDGKYLIVDPYEESELKSLVFHAVLNYFNKDNLLDGCVNKIVTRMKSLLGKQIYGSRSNQVISKLYDKNGQVISTNARFYTQNFEALTTSTKRDGHGLLGKTLINLFATKEVIYSVFIRLTKEDLDHIKRREGKETKYITNHPRINVLCCQDLVFMKEEMKQKVELFRSSNLHQQTEKTLIKEIQYAFNNGLIRVNTTP
ncbi:MAG: hypothetical protein NTY75_04160 [Candidatus Shapirobacteria bacterium]|nr:hypothetical protein [Candidatus Shapirobacteria bacterium]